MEEYSGACYYEFEVSNVHELSRVEYTPRFETSPNIFWQLAFKPKSTANSEFCSLMLIAVRNQSEGSKLEQNRRNAFPIKLFLKNEDGFVIKERERSILENSRVTLHKLVKRSTLPDIIKIGVRFNKVQFSPSTSQIPFPKREIPKDLIALWSKELLTQDGADTRITVEGQHLYAKSSILKKRSEYFRTMLDGPWAENNSNDDKFAYIIEITDFNYSSVFQMLCYLYTDQIQFYNNNNNNIWELYGIANKYLITELEEQIKGRILRGIGLKTCAEMLFRYAWKWPALKDEFMKYVVQNFNTVRNTDEFKMIVENKDDYPMFLQLNTEILLSYVPEEPKKDQESSGNGINSNENSKNLG